MHARSLPRSSPTTTTPRTSTYNPTDLEAPVIDDGARMVPAGGDVGRAFSGAKRDSGQPVSHLPWEFPSSSELLVAELAVECLSPAPANGVRHGTVIVCFGQHAS